MKRRVIIGILFISLIFVVANTAPEANPLVEPGSSAGFWLGLWHGVCSPINASIGLFSSSTHFYEVRNNGNWYDSGFYTGVIIAFNLVKVIFREFEDRMGW